MNSTTPPPGSPGGPPGPSSAGPSPYLPPYPGTPPHQGAPPHQGPPPHPGAPPHQGAPRPPRGAAFFESLRRSGLARGQDRWIGGVASGIAARLGIDPLIVRGAFVVLALFGGAAIIVYGVAWALLPEATDGRIHLEGAIRGRFDAALAGAIAFVLVGMSRPTFWFESGRWLPDWLVAFAWLGLVATVVLAAVLVTRSARRSRIDRGSQNGPTPPFGSTPYGSTPYGSASFGASPSDASPASNAPLDPRGQGTMSAPPGPGSTMTPGAPTPYPAYLPPAGQGGAGQYAAPTFRVHQPGAPMVADEPAAWQPPPRRPRTPGPGAPTVTAAWALAFLAGAAVLIGHRLELLSGNAALTIAGVTIVVLGLAALVSGARGRRAGSLGVIAVLIAIFAVPSAVVLTELPDWRRAVVSGGPVVAGDVRWLPSTAEEAASGYSYAVGEAQVDLTGPDWIAAAAGGTPTRVLVEAGAGSTTVILPTGVPLEVRTNMGLGEVRSSLRGDWDRTISTAGARSSTIGETNSSDGLVSRTEASGSALDVVLRSPAAGDLALILTIDAAIGDVIIEEVLR